MKKLFIAILAVFVLAGIPPPATASFHDTKTAHELFIYPIVRVPVDRGAGSGTIIYSALNDKGKYSTYVLTNHHVISDAIKIIEEWDPTLQENVKRERRALVHAEIFQYRDISTPIGTLKVEADIVIYNRDEDMALLRLRSETQMDHVARLRPVEKADTLFVLERTMAVGCSLAMPPLPTPGVVTRLNQQVQSHPFHMSSSQVIYGNSGGAMFHEESGELIGIPSRVAVIGWGTPITHMGLFIPISRVYDWLEKEHYDFIFDGEKNEKDSLEAREEAIKERQKAQRR
jgi:S1-C subfamily serine protease